MKRGLLAGGLLSLMLLSLVGLLIFTPNPLGKKIIREAKALGYLPYTPTEAVALAYKRCTNCHTEEKILKYCSRCGPPFIVVVHFMKRYIDIANKQGVKVRQLTDAEAVAITQVWNGLVGNWEGDWQKKDIKKLLSDDEALIRLLETPVEERGIESALRGKSAPGSYKEEGGVPSSNL